MQLINEYRDWVNKDVPVTSEWEEEINQIIYLRDLLHAEVTNNNNISMDIKKIDAKWHNTILKTSDGSFSIDIDRQDKPRGQWWWWIDKLDELTEEQRSTL